MKLDEIEWHYDPNGRCRWDSNPGRRGKWVMVVKHPDGTYTILGPADSNGGGYWSCVDALTAQAVLCELHGRGVI